MKKKILCLLVAAAALVGAVGCANTDKKTNDKKQNVQSSNDKDVKDINKIDTKKVQEALKDDSWVVVDTRLNDAFNGWKLDGVSRGGHIKGAVDFSANWLKVDDKEKDAKLSEILKDKGITEDKNIILYDVNGKDAKEVAAYLKGEGFENINIYDMNEWADDSALAMEKYENYDFIVPAVVVKDVIDGKKPETFEDAENIKIVEVSWGEEKTSYAKGHVPTTFHVNTDDFEPPTATEPIMWLLGDNETLEKFAQKYGFTKDDTVILTGAEQMAAYRLATVLEHMGIKDARVLNGGDTAWTMAGYELEKESHKPVPVESFGAEIPAKSAVMDSMSEVQLKLNKDENFQLLDNRTWKEHVGEISGYSYHDKKGRVPGAIYAYAGKTDAYSLDYYRNIDKTMRNFNEIAKMWEDRGVDLNKHLSFMCGSGWRVAEIYTYANVYGIKDTGIFSDGWIGWSNGGNPIETGEPVK